MLPISGTASCDSPSWINASTGCNATAFQGFGQGGHRRVEPVFPGNDIPRSRKPVNADRSYIPCPKAVAGSGTCGSAVGAARRLDTDDRLADWGVVVIMCADGTIFCPGAEERGADARSSRGQTNQHTFRSIVTSRL